MTQAELDKKIYELRNFIADKFKDIQMQAQMLKNPEDSLKANQTLTKISDCISDIRRAYNDLSSLASVIPEENEEENNTFSFALRKSMV